MKKLSVKAIVEFRGKSDRSKKAFVDNLVLDKKGPALEGGGDYWVTSLSSVSKSFKSNDLTWIVEKIDDLEEKLRASDFAITKTMYKRNISILNNYKEFDFKKWRPLKNITFLTKHKSNFILKIKGLEVEVKPHHVFTFQNGSTTEVGAIWFIAKLNGFRKEELGMFTDILYRYLKIHHSKNNVVNSKYCIAVDVFNSLDVNYRELETGKVTAVLDSCLDEIRKLM